MQIDAGLDREKLGRHVVRAGGYGVVPAMRRDERGEPVLSLGRLGADTELGRENQRTRPVVGVSTPVKAAVCTARNRDVIAGMMPTRAASSTLENRFVRHRSTNPQHP